MVAPGAEFARMAGASRFNGGARTLAIMSSKGPFLLMQLFTKPSLTSHLMNLLSPFCLIFLVATFIAI